MDFKLISKNNVGSAVLLLLVIALSQARVFNFLIDTALGRFFLIIFVLCLSYCHKILGVVGVLFVIIMFNSNLYEGFGNNSSSGSSSKPSSSSNSSSSSMPSFNSNSNDSSSTDASSNSTTQANSDQIKQIITQKIKDASQNNTSDSSESSDSSDSSKKNRNSKAAEGFDILGIENNIKRGKQSNSIPVNSFMRDADSILPYEGTSFLGSFSPF